MNEDYNQKFYVPIDKRHLFRGVSASGYLPALSPNVEPSQSSEPVIHYQNVPYKELEQIKGMLLNTRDKLQAHLKTKTSGDII